MDNSASDDSATKLAQQRLCELLEKLTQRGYSQNEAAQRAGIPRQYLSDIKCGRRPMTELAARRIGETFAVSFEWLQGQSDQASLGSESASTTVSGVSSLPLFYYPVTGDPRAHPKWDGALIELTGPAAVKVAFATWPYVLRFDNNDHRGRLCRGDLLFISQEVNDEAEFQVIRHGKGCYLARRGAADSWVRIATKEVLKDCRQVGHVVGIVWAPM
jgi:transcriptional regulator with XRE-family HTH domain